MTDTSSVNESVKEAFKAAKAAMDMALLQVNAEVFRLENEADAYTTQVRELDQCIVEFQDARNATEQARALARREANKLRLEYGLKPSKSKAVQATAGVVIPA